MTLRHVLKRILFPVLAPAAKMYLARSRKFRFENLKAEVHPGVFHPGLFLSTKILLRFLSQLDLKGKRFLELGCGTGVVSVRAAQLGARVTASDISATALANAKVNAGKNGVEVELVNSDLFQSFPSQRFDVIMINPPYYPKNPGNEEEHAWYCGEGHEYFHRLFAELKNYLNPGGEVFLILSEDCDQARIQEIAQQNHWSFEVALTKKVWGERNDIFRWVPEDVSTPAV